MIKSSPIHLAEVYEKLWKELNIDEDKSRKRKYFDTVRNRYNSERNPEDFLFIMRTTTNGMPRYNKNGEFNNSFHITRNGIQPNKLYKILQEWSNKLNQYQVEFYAKSYDQVHSEVGDLLYLDPPYFNTKGMYYGTIDYKVFFDWLKKQSGKYLLSFDGISGEIDNTVDVPKDIYSKHEYLLSGNSSFKRTIGKSNDSIVYESLYVK